MVYIILNFYCVARNIMYVEEFKKVFNNYFYHKKNNFKYKILSSMLRVYVNLKKYTPNITLHIIVSKLSLKFYTNFCLK